jgi:hypothetical protein
MRLDGFIPMHEMMRLSGNQGASDLLSDLKGHHAVNGSFTLHAFLDGFPVNKLHGTLITFIALPKMKARGGIAIAPPIELLEENRSSALSLPSDVAMTFKTTCHCRMVSKAL